MVDRIPNGKWNPVIDVQKWYQAKNGSSVGEGEAAVKSSDARKCDAFGEDEHHK